MKECTIQLQVGKIQKQNKQETREREREKKEKKENQGYGRRDKKKKKALLELVSSTAGAQKHTVEHQIQAEIL